MDINPKQFVKSSTNEKTLTFSSKEEIVKDDDDPLSIRDTSLSIFGIILAFLTVFFPASFVFLDRPLFQDKALTPNQIFKKDGY